MHTVVMALFCRACGDNDKAKFWCTHACLYGRKNYSPTCVSSQSSHNFLIFAQEISANPISKALRTVEQSFSTVK